MRFALAATTLCLVASSSTAWAQDDRLPVVRPVVEVLKASPTPFPFADKKPADYDTWIRTPWLPLNRARCGEHCALVSVRTSSGLAQIDVAGAKKGFAKMRLGVTIPSSCADYAWYGEMKDQAVVGAAIKDPSDHPIELSRIHVFRFDERGREISMVFQNEHPGSARDVRLNVLCKTK